MATSLGEALRRQARQPESESVPRPLILDGRELCFWYRSHIARAAASCRYRIGNLTELLRGATAVLDRPLTSSALRGKSTVIALRPLIDPKRARQLDGLRKRGIRWVADFDDLLFDCAPEDYPPILQSSGHRSLHEQRLRGYRMSLAYFDAFTVATEPLAEHLRALRPAAPVHVVPNGLSRAWVRRGLLLYPLWQPGMAKIIRYLPGSPSHDHDFAIIRRPLSAFLAAHPDVRLEIVGHLRFDAEGFPRDRISQRTRVPFHQLAELLASSWVTLAPLAPTAYNRCKTSIKFLEAAAFACPTIATPIPDMQRHRDAALHHAGPLFATSDDDWNRALTDLLDDDTRLAIGRKAQAYVLDHATADASVAALDAARKAWS
jgi:glycosyltransferase involved in cell wall biosynthesis